MQATIRASDLNRVNCLPREALAAPEEPAWSIAWLCTSSADPHVAHELDVRQPDVRAAAGLSML